MSHNVFDPIDPIRFGWNTLKSNLKFFFVLMVIVAVLYNLPSLIWTLVLSEAAASDSSIIIAVFALIAVASGIIYLVMELGLLDISLSFRDGLLPQIQDLFRQYPLLLKYLAAYIIYSLMVFIGFMLLIVPGIYLGLKYQFYGYLIVDKRLGPIEALKESSRMTSGAIMNLFVFWLSLYCGIAIIMIIFMIFITIPLGLMAQASSPDMVLILSTIFSFIISVIAVLVILPITKLATADIYRILEARLAASSAPPALSEEI